MGAVVTAVSRSGEHRFSKANAPMIRLLAGLGVEGDAHLGALVRHSARVAADPTKPNLRQVHLIHAELHDELEAAGFQVAAGDLGENVTTRGLDLLGLPYGARLHLGEQAVVELTGLRNPCQQINDFRRGLLWQVLDWDTEGRLVRKVGVMSVVRAGGEVRPGDPIEVELPPLPHLPLDPI
ncbi:MOSC domain-containing protein [Streptacidiphilus sp. 4-A2]|nr:MOSC domain-containing protein [Streptacidiphilus sp. 4-A2]